MARSVLLCGALVLATATARAQPPVQSQGPPNVVLIVADDLGWGDIGAHGQALIATPRIDRLAAEGMRFSAGYAGAPVCAPSRCVLLTGLHAGHCPVGANQYPNATLRIDEVTIAHLLRGAGYHTAIAGKWGLGGELADGTAHQVLAGPWAMGFERSLVHLDQGLAADPWPEWLWADGERVPLYGNAEEGRAQYAPSLFLEETLREIDRAAQRGQPFFVVLASTLPHREIAAEDESRYASEPWPAIERAYAALVTRFDDDVGRIVDHLDARGLGASTLVLVASDNGPASVDGHHAEFFASSGPFRGGKRDLTEGGLRVPLIARWPGVIPAGTVREVAVGLVDLLPTLAELAGLGAPRGLDGVSIAGMLRGEETQLAPRDLVWTTHEATGGPGELASRAAVRRGAMKLIEREGGGLELYDLALDPGEHVDRAGDDPELVRALHEVAARESSGPPARVDPVLRVIGEGVREQGLDDAPVPVLWAGFDELGAGLHERAASSRIASPAIALRGAVLGNDAVSAPFVAGLPNLGSARFTERSHLVAGPHPALALGAASVTIEAWLRLAREDGERARWLVVGKPAGRDLRFIDFAVLARSGPVEGVTWLDAGGAPRGVAVVFGDRRPRRGAWGLRSTLAIDDERWHRLAVRIDHERRSVIFDLDARRDEAELPQRDHVIGSGLLHVGAHPTEGGALEGALHGTIDELRITRGVLADGALLGSGAPRLEPAVAVLDLGRVVRGSPTIERRIRIVEGSTTLSRAMEGRVDARAIDDPRLAIDAPGFAGLVGGAGSAEIVVRFTPDRMGRLIDQRLTILATIARLGAPARRSPLSLRIDGEVVAPAPLDGGVGGAHRAPSAGCAITRSASGASPFVFALLLIASRARRWRARRGATRARDRGASAGATPRRS